MTNSPEGDERARRRGERRALLLAFLAFFFLLCGYFVLRPLREEAGVAGGVRNIKWLYLGTFFGMLAATPFYAFLVSHWPRAKIIAIAFRFFIANILIFGLLRLDDEFWVWGSRVFYCWLSVFNLFVVSLFWSHLVDVFDPAHCRRLFGLVATGGSLGAIAGSLITDLGIGTLGPAALFLVPALMLECAHLALSRCARAIEPAAETAAPRGRDELIGGGLLEGLRSVLRSPYLVLISCFLLCMTTSSTFAYFEQANLVKRAWPDDPESRTRFFSRLNLGVQLLTLVFQALVTGAVVRRFGPGRALLALPLVCALGFLALGLATASLDTTIAGPGLAIAVLAVFQIAQQATSRGLASPTRQMLFAPLERSDKYKAKSFIDTVVYRGGDLASGFAFDGLIAIGIGLAGVAFLGVPLALLWISIARRIGRREARLRS